MSTPPEIERSAQFDISLEDFVTVYGNDLLNAATNAPFTDITRVISGVNNITDDDRQTVISESFASTSHKLSIVQGLDISH
jgi:hypothetical protein